MEKLYKISVFLHILGFAFWVGGMMFISFIIRPAIQKMESYPAILEKIATYFSKTTWFFIVD